MGGGNYAIFFKNGHKTTIIFSESVALVDFFHTFAASNVSCAFCTNLKTTYIYGSPCL